MVARVSGPLEYSPLPEHSETKRSMLTSRRATELSLRESGCGPWQKSQPAASRAAFWGEPVAAGHQGRRLFLTHSRRGEPIHLTHSHADAIRTDRRLTCRGDPIHREIDD